MTEDLQGYHQVKYSYDTVSYIFVFLCSLWSFYQRMFIQKIIYKKNKLV